LLSLTEDTGNEGWQTLLANLCAKHKRHAEVLSIKAEERRPSRINAAIAQLLEQIIKGGLGKLCNLISRMVDSCDILSAFIGMLRSAFACIRDSACASSKLCDIIEGFLKTFFPVVLALAARLLLGKLLDRIKSIICKVRCIVEKIVKEALDLVITALYKAFGQPAPNSAPPGECGNSCPPGKPCPDRKKKPTDKPPVKKDSNCGARCQKKGAPKPGNCFAAETLIHTLSGPQPIQTLRIGQRVVTFLPHERRGDAPVEPTLAEWAAHRLVTATLWFEDGEFINVQLLRDPDWFRMHQPEVDKAIYLDLPEMGVQGEGIVDAIEPCPPIESGEGRIITAAFHHSTGECLDIHTTGQEKATSTTGGHPFWRLESEDRNLNQSPPYFSQQFESNEFLDSEGNWQLSPEFMVATLLETANCGLSGQWVPSEDLRINDRLQTLAGAAAILSVSESKRIQTVFNIEVEGDHVYRVGESGVLVHNASVPGEDFDDEYDSFDDAIGEIPPNFARCIEKLRSNNLGAIARGFTERWIGLNSDDEWWSAFHNPTTGKFAGAHRSSRND